MDTTNTPPDLSIVVLNWNTSDLLEDSLQAIASTAGSLSIEVTVIDNASTDGGFSHLPQPLRDDLRFSYVQNDKNIGWLAINIMPLRSRSTYILTIDPDAIVHPGALHALFNFMESHPEAGAATANLRNSDGTPQRYYRRLTTPLAYFFTTLIGRLIDKYFFKLRHFRAYRYEDLDITKTSEVEQPSWPCLIWRKEAVVECIVDPDLPFYFPDVEMSRRLYSAGYKIYMVSDALAAHLKSTSFGRAADDWRRREYDRSLLVYFRKHYLLWLPLVWVLLMTDIALRWTIKNIAGHEPLR